MSALAGPRVRHLGLEAVSARPGGLNRYFAALVVAERSIGIEADAVVLGPGDPTISPPAGTSFASSIAAPLPLRLRAMARAAIRPPLPDLVDAHFALYAALPLRGRLRRSPLVVHFQGPWAEESSVEGASRAAARVKRWIEARVYRRADAVVVLSEAFRELVTRSYGVSPFAVTRISPGVDLERFIPGDRRAARAQLGLDPDGVLLVAVRRLRTRMGLELLIEALEGLDVGRPLQLAIVGDGPERSRLEALAQGSTVDVRFAGRVDDDELLAWYQAADLSVVPSLALEGFGLIVLESLATGTPVLASDLDGLRDALGPFDPAALVTAGDLGALRAGILDQLVEGGSRSTDACRRYAEGFDWESVARRHETLYQRVLERRAGAGLPRVVVVGHTAQLSGGELAMARLLPALSAKAAIHVILGQDGPLVERLRAAGISVELLPMSSAAAEMRKDAVTARRIPGAALVGSLSYSLRLAKRLRQLDPDIVHTNTLKAALYGGLAARMARVPAVVWHLRDRIAEDYLPPSAVRLVRAAAPRLADAVIANSAASLVTLGELGLPAAVIPSPLDPSIHAVLHDETAPIRIGILGRLAAWKGQDLFLRAFAEAFGDRSDVEAVIVGAPLFGETDFEASLIELAEELGLDGRVEFRGFRNDVASELAGLQIVVHCSVVPEPFGQVVVEAMAAGCAVIASDAGGPRTTITDGVDGLLSPMGDQGALARAMRALADDPHRRQALGAAGVTSAERYRPERVSDEVAAIYEEVLGR